MNKSRQPRPPKKQKMQNPGILAVLWDWTKSIVFGLMVFLPIRFFVLQTYAVISGSMEDTFLIGDFVVVNKVAYGATVPLTEKRLPGVTSPHRGDAVVFWSNHDREPTALVKRLIGLPGDTVAMNAGKLSVNGSVVFEPHVKHINFTDDSMFDANLLWHRKFLVGTVDTSEYFPTRETWGPLVVPQGRYFMMGDNRDNSWDSRWWGFVKFDEIIGRADLIYFSWDKGVGPRVSRIGRRIVPDRK